MATGKTHPRWMRLIMDEIDLSGDSRQIGTFGVNYDMADVTGWSNGIHYYIFGQANHTFTGYQAVFNNTALLGSHIELSAVEEYIISLPIGIRAAPAIGDPAFLSSMQQVTYDVEGDGPILVSVDAEKAITDSDHEKAFGVTLMPGTTLSASTNSASVDNGASSANGGLGHLHITSLTDDRGYSIRVEDSPDDGAWSTLILFTVDGTSVTAEAKDVTGTVDRYLRFSCTSLSGSGSTTFWMTFARQ